MPDRHHSTLSATEQLVNTPELCDMPGQARESLPETSDSFSCVERISSRHGCNSSHIAMGGVVRLDTSGSCQDVHQIR